MASDIDTSLLVAAPMLQDAIISKVAEPLINGVISCYVNSSRTTYKNWYYQSSYNASSATPVFTALPNPLTLSASGTICDVNGNDVIPYFYPYSETDDSTIERYYITVYDQLGKLQFTRSYFPFNVVPVASVIATTTSENNLLTNNRFWRNNYTSSALIVTPTTLGDVPTWNDGEWTYQYNTTLPNNLSFYYATLAPSQHDGFSMPDCNYVSQNLTVTETLQFKQFSQSLTPILTGDITPQYYLEWLCTGNSASTQRFVQFPLSYQLLSIGSTYLTFTIQSYNLNSAIPVEFSIYLYEFLGSDQVSAEPLLIGTIIPSATEWTKTVLDPYIVGNNNNLSISTGTSDSAYYIQIVPPLGSASFDVAFALPSAYLSTSYPTNDFATYDEIDAVVGTPRTGDIRTSINSFYPFGWVPMNDGTIGYNATVSTFVTTRNNVDTWPLYNLLWNAFGIYSTGTTTSGANPIAPMFDSIGTQVAYGPNIAGSSAVADFNAGKALSLTRSMGKVMLGTVPIDALLPATATIAGYTSVITAADSGGYLQLTTTNAINIFNGMPFTVSNENGVLPTGLSADTIYYAAVYSGNAMLVSPTFAQALAARETAAGNCIPWTSGGAGTGTNTLFAEPTGSIEGEYAHTQLTSELAAHTHPPQTGAFIYTGTGTGFGGGGSQFNPSGSETGVRGSSIAANVTQPGSFYNVFMKL